MATLPGITLFAALSMVATVAFSQTTLRVPSDYRTIQSAIDAAKDGDTVWVAPGSYFEQIDFRGRAISVRSSNGALQTTIDARTRGTVVTFAHGESRGAVLDGFTVRGGVNPQHAGGIHIEGASPTVRNNRIVGNIGGRQGHGISVVASVNALIEGNLIAKNHSIPQGNGSGGGGGIGVRGAGAVEIRGNQILDNVNARFSSGGGIYLENAGAARIVGNWIEGNVARLEGGGIAIFGASSAHIENNLIAQNQVVEPGKGGGVAWALLPGTNAVSLVNNTIAHNHAERGSAVYADGDDRGARIVNNLLLALPDQSALECGDFYDSAPPLAWSNDAVSDTEAYAGECAQVAGSAGNLSFPVQFSATPYRLAPRSFGIDAGDDAASSQSLDLDARARIRDGNADGIAQIDLGAFEY